MEKEKLQKGINDLNKIRLSEEERALILSKVLAGGSPVWTVSPWVVFMKTHLVALTSLFVLCLGGYVAVASEKALPGEVFYGVKVNITEPARDLIKIMPEEKIDWQEEKAKRRIEEAKLLVAEDKIDEKKKEEINNLFEKHKDEFKKVSEKEIETEEKKRPEKSDDAEKGVIIENKNNEKKRDKLDDDSDDKEEKEKEEDAWKTRKEELQKRLDERLKKLEESKNKVLEKKKDRAEKIDR